MHRRAFLQNIASFGILGFRIESFRQQTPRIRAIFHTLDDNKEPDTVVSIQVRRGPEIIAYYQGTLSHLDRGSTYAVDLKSEAFFTRNDLDRGCSLTIRIDPNGHDTWIFNLELRSEFAGPPWLQTFGKITLDQEKREYRSGW